MTYFTVGIIVPEDKLLDLPNFIDAQMEPYDDSTEVEPYISYSIRKAKADIERDIARLERIIERQEPEYDPDKCREFLTRLRNTSPEEHYREYVQFHEHFNAKGKPISTCNPNGKWDSWVIGGHWDGRITGKKDASSEAVEDNIATTEQAIEREIIPDAIITPDRRWHDHGLMGWWANLSTDNHEWKAPATKILASYPGFQIVILEADLEGYVMKEPELSSITKLAGDAFWDVIVKCFPVATSGDLSPLTTFAFDQAAEAAVEEWVWANVPRKSR